MHDSDWSLLPLELLQTVSEKVVTSVMDYADHIRFHAVCHRWQSVLSPHPLHLPLQLPWLMIPNPSYSGNADDSTCLFYDFSTSKFHCLDLPETRGFEICGSSPGWFILCKNLQLSLLNPITHAVISLLDFTGPPFHLGFPPPNMLDGELFFQNCDSDRYVMEHTTDVLHILKAILTSSPLDPSCLVFVHNISLWLLSFCKIGDDHWTVIEFEYRVPLKFHYFSDFTYSNGCLYTINRDGAVTMYSLNTPSRVMLNCSVQCEGSMNLVDGSSPEILPVANVIPEVPESETEYIVYKFSNGEEPKWIEVSDIGQNVLFVSGGRNAIILPSANLQLPGWGANCLCCDSTAIERYYQEQSSVALFNHRIKLARLDDGKVITKTRDLGSFQNQHWLKSLWLTPSFN